MDKDVAVVIGVGGMGLAIARRVGGGHRVLLADFHATTLNTATEQLRSEGHHVTAQPVDVSDPDSVISLADAAAGLGRVTHVVHTAGLSPVQAPPKRFCASTSSASRSYCRSSPGSSPPGAPVWSSPAWPDTFCPLWP